MTFRKKLRSALVIAFSMLTMLASCGAEKAAQEMVLRLCTMVEKFGFGERLDVLGPTPCVIERINSYYRFQILIKNRLEEKGHQFISSFLDKVSAPKDIRMTVDVDPLDIL